MRVKRAPILILCLGASMAGLAGCQSTVEPKPAALSSVAASAKKTDGAQTAALLTQANFVKKLADTPSRKANLPTLPQNQLLMRQANNGATVYIYADAACPCVFVGDQAAHQQYQALRAQSSAGYDEAVVLANPELLDDWDIQALGGAAAR